VPLTTPISPTMTLCEIIDGRVPRLLLRAMLRLAAGLASLWRAVARRWAGGAHTQVSEVSGPLYLVHPECRTRRVERERMQVSDADEARSVEQIVDELALASRRSRGATHPPAGLSALSGRF